MSWYTVSLTILLAIISKPLDARGIEDDGNECRLYMGVSTLSSKNFPRIGVYSGVDLEKGSIISEGDISIPIIDIPLQSKGKFWLWGFGWDAEITYSQFESGWRDEGVMRTQKGSVISIMPGLGMIAGTDDELVNIEWLEGYENDVMEDDVQTAVSGSYSRYGNVRAIAKHSISAGQELLLHPAQQFSPRIMQPPTPPEHKKANKVLQGFVEFLKQVEEEDMTDEWRQEAWQFLLQYVVEKNVADLLPLDSNEVPQAAAMGIRNFMLRDQSIKSKEWLTQNAVCIDRLHVKPSTVPHAGHGAFANHFIAKGSNIITTPIVHFENGKKLLEYKHLQNNDKSLHHQLLLNYCFAHPQSSLLLYPAAPITNYINHNASPNAKIIWSKTVNKQQPYLDYSLEKLKKLTSFSLYFDIIAIEDIQPNEEIFIDYGPLWQDAWDKHSQSFTPPHNKNYHSSFLFQKDHFLIPYKTFEQLQNDPYPRNMELACFLFSKQTPIKGTMSWNDSHKTYSGHHLHSCHVLKVLTTSPPYQYLVLYLNHEFFGSPFEVENVPHEFIRFVDAPYESNMHLADAFRFGIGMPDEMFPAQWKDLE